jgi:hypothetical protein
MNSALGRVLLVIGVVLVVAGAIVHFAVRVNIVPHFSIILGVVGVIVAGLGVYGMVAKSPSA